MYYYRYISTACFMETALRHEKARSSSPTTIMRISQPLRNGLLRETSMPDTKISETHVLSNSISKTQKSTPLIFNDYGF